MGVGFNLEGGYVLRLLINILIFFLIVRLARALVRGGGGFMRRVFGGQKRATEPPSEAPPAAEPYSKITPYEIEDAEYEEIRD